MKSIQGRIALPYLVLTLGLMVFVSLLFVNLARESEMRSLEGQLEIQARIVERTVGANFSQRAKAEELQPLIQGLAEGTGSRITLIDPAGQAIADSEADPATLENYAAKPEVAMALAGNVGKVVRPSGTTEQEFLYVALPIGDSASPSGVVRVAFPIVSINQFLAQIVTAAAGLALAIGVVAILIAVGVARTTTRPIDEVIQAARSIAGGDLNQRIYARSQDELGLLADAFNEMATRLQRTITNISEEKDKMAAVLGNIADAIVMTDRESRITLLNHSAAELFAITESRAVGRAFIEVVQDYELSRAIHRCLESGEPQQLEAEFGPDKRILRMSVARLGRGEPGAALIVFQDRTELRRLEAVRREFVGNVSHELRTPLASIKAVVETLQAGALENPEDAKGFLEKINIEVDEMTNIVRELLELSRIESGKAGLAPQRVQLGGLVREALQRLRPQAERKNLSIEIQLPQDLPSLLVDQDRLMQVLMNLLHNAIKFTHSDGHITIGAEQRNGEVCIHIADTGVGIPVDDLAHVFERFYKADKARTTEGTGLGLAIAKHVVQAHGGRIWAESIEGQGATFFFTVPAAP